MQRRVGRQLAGAQHGQVDRQDGLPAGVARADRLQQAHLVGGRHVVDDRDEVDVAVAGALVARREGAPRVHGPHAREAIERAGERSRDLAVVRARRGGREPAVRDPAGQPPRHAADEHQVTCSRTCRETARPHDPPVTVARTR